jgi:hypothetical protein
MTLDEEYTILKRRKMPEHDRLVYAEGDWYLYTDVPMQRIPEEDARAILAIHALQWWLGTLHRSKYAGRRVSESASWHPDMGDYREMGHLRTAFDYNPLRYINHTKGLIPAIVEATMHMDQKDDDEKTLST